MFSSSSSKEDICKKAKEAITEEVGTFLGEGKFLGIAVVKCGYKFVWYELGYSYFTAGRIPQDGHHYILSTDNDGKYDANCGQIVFFP